MKFARLRPRMGLSTRIGSLLVLVGTVPLVLLALALVTSARDSMRNAVYERNEIVARMAGNAVAQHLTADKRLIDEMADREEVRQALAANDEASLRTILARTQEKNPHFDTLFVLSADGRTQYDSRDGISGLGQTFLEHGYYAEATSANSTIVSEALRGPGDNTPVIAVASPVHQDSGEISGVLVGAVSLTDLSRSLESTRTSDAGWVTVVDTNGTIVADSDVQMLMRSIAGASPAVSQAMAGNLGHMEQRSYRGEDTLASFAPITGFDLGIIVEEPMQQAFSGTAQLFWYSVAWSAAVLAIAIVLALLLSRRITNPLNYLRRAVATTGQGNLDDRVQVRTGDEIQELAETFNTMADQLQEKVEQLGFALQRAQAERSRAETITSVSADGIMVVDEHQRITDVNPALEKLTGYSAEELLGQHCKYFLQAEGKDGVSLCDQVCPFTEPLSTQKAVEATINTKGGHVIWTAVTYGVIPSTDGEIKGIVHNIRDMSGQKEVQRLKDEFMSTISHELRTPLTAILGYDEMLLKGIRGPVAPRQEETLRSIRGNALRLLSLINDLLDVTRLESGEVVLSRQSLDMQAAVEKALSSVATLAATKGLVLQQGIPDGLPSAFADKDKFQQILYNLLSNAIKFTPEGKTVTVSARAKAVLVQDSVDRRSPAPFETTVVEVQVKDQGIGIKPDQLPHIWDRFYQGDSSPSRRYAGTGLGLAIVKNLVELHGGSVWAESSGPGQGATFAFTLPMSSAKKEQSAPAEGPYCPAVGHPQQFAEGLSPKTS